MENYSNDQYIPHEEHFYPIFSDLYEGESTFVCPTRKEKSVATIDRAPVQADPVKPERALADAVYFFVCFSFIYILFCCIENAKRIYLRIDRIINNSFSHA